MKSLSNDWITEGLIDVEYKTYLLLAYLSDIEKEFNESKIYPGFSDLYSHYQNLVSVKTGREQMKNSFPKALNAADWTNLRFEYETKVTENDFFQVVDEIIDYSIPAIKTHLDSGKELIELVDKNLNISEIGLSAPFTKNGYFFLCAPPKKETKVYQYALTNIVLEDGNYKALQVSHLSNIPLSYSTTFESIKKDIIQNSKPNSGLATYLIESELYFPWEESLLPVAKRRFIEYLTKQPTSNF
jgi:uncharacterized protein YktA (UPF0223 family)